MKFKRKKDDNICVQIRKNKTHGLRPKGSKKVMLQLSGQNSTISTFDPTIDCNSEGAIFIITTDFGTTSYYTSKHIKH